MTYSLFGEDEVQKQKEILMPQANVKSPMKVSSKKSSVKKQNENQNPNSDKKVNEQSSTKRLKTEDTDALRNIQDRASNIKINKEHNKIAFKGIIELDRDVKKQQKNFLRIDELWEWVVANHAGKIESREFLLRIVQDLDDKSKIVFNKQDESIYLL